MWWQRNASYYQKQQDPIIAFLGREPVEWSLLGTGLLDLFLGPLPLALKQGSVLMFVHVDWV